MAVPVGQPLKQHSTGVFVENTDQPQAFSGFLQRELADSSQCSILEAEGDTKHTELLNGGSPTWWQQQGPAHTKLDSQPDSKTESPIERSQHDAGDAKWT